jgi:hypothetical protein
MSENDRLLIEEAYKAPYWRWEDVYTSMEDADDPEIKAKLKTIASILWDVYQERGYYDPTEEEDMQAVQSTRVSIFRWLMQALRGSK